jgi:hypothetical protein
LNTAASLVLERSPVSGLSDMAWACGGVSNHHTPARRAGPNGG